MRDLHTRTEKRKRAGIYRSLSSHTHLLFHPRPRPPPVLVPPSPPSSISTFPLRAFFSSLLFIYPAQGYQAAFRFCVTVDMISQHRRKLNRTVFRKNDAKGRHSIDAGEGEKDGRLENWNVHKIIYGDYACQGENDYADRRRAFEDGKIPAST